MFIFSCSVIWSIVTTGRNSAGMGHMEVTETGTGAALTNTSVYCGTQIIKEAATILPGPIKTTMRYHFTPIRMVIAKKQKASVG